MQKHKYKGAKPRIWVIGGDNIDRVKLCVAHVYDNTGLILGLSPANERRR